MANKPLVKCKFCGNTGRTKTVWRGSKTFERFLWLTLLIPGPFYTYWRWRGRKELCNYCESDNFEPVADVALPAKVAEAEKTPDLGHEEHRF
ncbi:MAG: hypothetical protein MK052_02170 [Alphaproteobacteria bacterium]|nr:hypothetical protein [Alphaproteobacteria bacterium]